MKATACTILLLVCGCASFREKGSLTVRQPEPDESLQIHCDFDLPSQQVVREDLSLLREFLLERLALPAPTIPVQVQLFGDLDRFESFLNYRFPEFPQRRAFFVASDTELVVYAHWNDRITEDLRHEVTHGYLHGTLQELPLWLDEGLAEYSEVFDRRGRLHLTHLDHLLSLHNRGLWTPDLKRIERIKSMSEMTQLDYAEAWCWVHWLLESDPQTSGLLRDYVRICRTSSQPPPLSSKLPPTEQVSEQLSTHLRGLAKPR